MTDNLFATGLTWMQLFIIGLGFGFVGPCAFSCTPSLIAFLGGSGCGWRGFAGGSALFFAGRLSAYCILGAIAGVSGAAIRRFAGAGIAGWGMCAAGVVGTVLALMIMHGLPQCGRSCDLRARMGRPIFAFGFFLGIAPCGPLIALLFEIALMSKGALQGAGYAFWFGCGTAISGIAVAAGVGGVLTGVARVFLRSERGRTIFRIACAVILIFISIGMIAGGWQRFSHETVIF